MDFWSNAWDKLQDSVSDQWETFKEVGAPALQAGIEKQAIEWLQKQNEETQKKLDAGVSRVVSEPASPLGQAVGASVGESLLKNYQMEIIFGVGALILVGMFLRK